VVHDEDPLPKPVPEEWNEDKRREKQRVFDANAQIAGLVRRGLGGVQMLKPLFEDACGISKGEADRKGKPIAALDHLEKLSLEAVPEALVRVINAAYGEIPKARPAVAAANN